MVVNFSNIKDATTLLAGQITATPQLYAHNLSQLTGANIYLKMENLQHTNSFKDRGALNLLNHIAEKKEKRGRSG